MEEQDLLQIPANLILRTIDHHSQKVLINKEVNLSLENLDKNN